MPRTRYDFLENYIYIYQLDKYCILPMFPDSISDNLGSTFHETNALSRTAPIQSYGHSGPRSVQFSLDLHRDMVNDVNLSNAKFMENVVSIDDDYVDTLIKYLQAAALPSYKEAEAAAKMINPPMVAVRFGNTMFVKGIISGDVGVTWQGALSADNKYQEAKVSLRMLEVDPQDAESIAKWGSFRGLETVMTKSMYKK